MTIQKAIRSGKKFKRRGWNDISWMFFPNPNSGNLPFIVEDILADDWEIDEKKVEITYSNFLEACNRAKLRNPHTLFPVKDMARELGLCDD